MSDIILNFDNVSTLTLLDDLRKVIFDGLPVDSPFVSNIKTELARRGIERPVTERVIEVFKMAKELKGKVSLREEIGLTPKEDTLTLTVKIDLSGK